MDYLKIINETISARGTTVAFISKRTGMNYEVLRRTLSGDRPMRADELMLIFDALGYEVSVMQKN